VTRQDGLVDRLDLLAGQAEGRYVGRFVGRDDLITTLEVDLKVPQL